MTIWYFLVISLVFFAAFSPNEFSAILQTMELSLKNLSIEVWRRWLLFRMWPRFQYDKARMWFILRRIRHNQNAKTTKSKL